MEVNQIYCSVEERELDGSIFVVDVEENETSVRLRLRGEYSLRIWTGGLSLLTLNTAHALYYWPYTVLRRYGTSKTGFSFETGRKSPTGPGVLRFCSPSGKLITQTIKETVAVIKCEKLMPNSNPETSLQRRSLHTSAPNINTERPSSYRTTDKSLRNADRHGDLLLEIPKESQQSNRSNRALSPRRENQPSLDLPLNLGSHELPNYPSTSHNLGSHELPNYPSTSHNLGNHELPNYPSTSHNLGNHELPNYPNTSHNLGNHELPNYPSTSHNLGSHELPNYPSTSHNLGNHELPNYPNTSHNLGNHELPNYPSTSHNLGSHELPNYPSTSHNLGSHELPNYPSTSHNLGNHELPNYPSTSHNLGNHELPNYPSIDGFDQSDNSYINSIPKHSSFSDQLSPNIPAPYNSLTRYHSSEKSNYRNVEPPRIDSFLNSTESSGSTFPVCVSPLPGTAVGGDSSSEDEIPNSKPIRKISQVTSKDGSANHDLIRLSLRINSPSDTSAQSRQSYMNVERRQLSKCNSNNFQDSQESIPEDPKRLSPDLNEGNSARYVNVLRNDVTNQQSDYYNFKPDKSPIPEPISDFKFSLASQNSHSTAGISHSDLIGGESAEMEYGEVHFHPSTTPLQAPGLYLNSPLDPNSYVNVSGNGNADNVEEAIYATDPNIPHPLRNSTMPTSPTKRMTGNSPSKLGNTIKLNSKSAQGKHVSSEYSYLTDILSMGQNPEIPLAYGRNKSQQGRKEK